MDSPFWDFSVAVYGADAVAGECLALQDQFGLDVNLVLLCAFLGAGQSVAMTEDDIASARAQVDQWHRNVVTQLRAARRALKTLALPDADTAKAATDVRTQVKLAELESERIEQMILQRWAGARLASRSRGNPRDIILASLQALLTAYGIGPERLSAAHAMQHLIAAALAY